MIRYSLRGRGLSRGPKRAVVRAVAEGLEGRVMLALPEGWVQQDIETDCGVLGADPGLSEGVNGDGPLAEAQPGLTMQVWTNMGRSGVPALTKIVSSIDFDWSYDAPDVGLPAEYFSTRFRGEVMAPETGMYRFISMTDDGGACWVNGELVSSDPGVHGLRDAPNTTPILLWAGAWYSIVFEQEERSGGAGAMLDWVLPSGKRERIPPGCFRTGSGPDLQAPGELSGWYTPEGGGILLRWNDDAIGETGYVVERSNVCDSDGFVAIAADLPENADSYMDAGVAPGQHYWYRVRAFADAEAGSYSNVVDVTTTSQQGLTMEVWNNPDHAGPPLLTRIVEKIDFNWGWNSPGDEIYDDYFSVRFSGRVTVPVTGFYEFISMTDDAGYCWVDGRLVSSHPGEHGASDAPNRAPIFLMQNQWYTIILDHTEHQGEAVAQLDWVLPGGGRQRIPWEYLQSTTVRRSIRCEVETDRISESAGVVPITVRLASAVAQTTTLAFSVEGTAIAGQDFTISPNPLVIPGGSSSGTIWLTVIDNAVYNESKLLMLTFAPLPGGSSGDITACVLTLLDDDWISVVIPSLQVQSQTSQVVTGHVDMSFDFWSSRSEFLAGYALQLAIWPPNSGVRLTGVGEPANAVFPGRTPGVFGSGDTLLVSDNLPGVGQANPIANGKGLVRVFYEIQPEVRGTFEIHVSGLELYDGDANLISGVGAVNGRIQVKDLTGPTVTGVEVSSTGWTASAFPYQRGYGIPGGVHQLDPLPWNSCDRIAISFSEGVTVTQGDLSVRGVNRPNYGFMGFNYDAGTRTATWTLSSAVVNDKVLIELSDNVKDVDGNRLDGEWIDGVSGFPSGNATAGGDFRCRTNVLCGDVNSSGNVGVDDVLLVRNQQFTSAGRAGYNAYYDINANGEIKINDVLLVRNRQFTSLPVGVPLSAAQPEPLAGEAEAITAAVQGVSITSSATSVVRGFVDVVLLVPPGLTAKLAGYETHVLLLPTGLGVSLTGVGIADGGVFAGQVPAVFNVTAGGLDVTDALMGVGQETEIVDGAGLFRIEFDVAPGTYGTFQIVLSGLRLYDGSVRLIAVGQSIAGEITVSPAHCDPVLEGGAGDDRFRLGVDSEGHWLQVWHGTAPPAGPDGTYVLSSMDTVVVRGGGGADLLYVDQTDGNPLGSAVLRIESGRITLEGSETTLCMGGLVVEGAATLDLGRHRIVIAGGEIGVLFDLVKSGRSGGSWIGPGITSTAAKNDASGFTGLGMRIDDQGYVVVKCTWNGDANIDGVVDADDYFLADSGYITQAGGWHNGDFNYDGRMDADDYFLIDSAFIGQGGALGAQELEGVMVQELGGGRDQVAKSWKDDEEEGLVAGLFSEVAIY